MQRKTGRQPVRVLLPAALFLIGMALAGCQSTAPGNSTGSSGSTAEEQESTTPVPGQEDDVTTVVVLGDSISTGLGTWPEHAWPNLLQESYIDRGMSVDVINGAQNGAGYVNVGPSGLTIGDEVERTVPAGADVVVLFGSINDRRYPEKEIRDGAGEAFANIKQMTEGAEIVVVGPSTFGPDVTSVRDAVRDAAMDVDVRFVDPLAEAWFSDGGSYAVRDGVHLNENGDAYVADKMKEILEPLVDGS